MPWSVALLLCPALLLLSSYLTPSNAGESCPIGGRLSRGDDVVGYDFEYFVSQVGIDTTLKNAIGAQLYQEKLCEQFRDYTNPSLAGSTSFSCFDNGGDDWCNGAGDAKNAGTTPNPDFFENAAAGQSDAPLGMFCGAEANWDYNSEQYRQLRTLTVSDTEVAIGGKNPRNPNSIGQFTFTGGLTAFIPGYFYGAYYFFWFKNVCCSGSPADLTLTIPKFTVTAEISKNPTDASFYFNTTCSAPVDPDTGIIFDGCNDCNYFFQHGFFQNFIKTCVVPAVNNYICPQLESYLLGDLQQWLLPDQVFRLGSSPISVEYTTDCLHFVDDGSVMIQAAMSFLVDNPGGAPTRFDKHRTSSMLPWQTWPFDADYNATTSAAAISREAIENFLDAANYAGYLKFNGTFVVYGTQLFVNGSIDNVSVAFPSQGVNADVTVNERDMMLHIHCDNYTGFRIFDVMLVKVSESGVVACQSWSSGLSMQLTDTKISDASMKGISTSLEIPTVLLKPLVKQGVSYALPVINEALSHLTFHFPNDVSWLAPLAPDPVTRTVGPSAGEEGHVEIIWTCQCGDGVNLTKRCGGSFCPAGATDGALNVTPALLDPAPPEACLPTDPESVVRSNWADELTHQLSLIAFPTSSCEALQPGENATVGALLVEATGSACFNVTSDVTDSSLIWDPMVDLLGDFAEISSLETTSAMLATQCSRTPLIPPTPSTCTDCQQTGSVEFGRCYGGLMVAPRRVDGAMDCEGVNLTSKFDATVVALQVQLVESLATMAAAEPMTSVNSTVRQSQIATNITALLGNTSSVAMTTASVFLLPTTGSTDDRCVKCAPDGVPFTDFSTAAYCQVTEFNGQLLVADLFCSSESCESDTCAKPSFTTQLQLSYQVSLGTEDTLLRFKMVNSSVVATCTRPSDGNLFGIPSWVWFSVGTLIVVGASAVLAVHLRRRAVRKSRRHKEKPREPLPPVVGPAVLFYTIFFVAVAAPVVWAWTFTNPASLQSENVTKTMSYAQSNQTNSSFGVNFDNVAPQMQSYVNSGLNVLLFFLCSLLVLVVGASFNCSRSWSFKRCGVVRAAALSITLLVPLMGFGMFVVKWNWLTVVQMGGSSNASDESSTVATVLSAVWLESVLVATLAAFANGMMLVPVVSVGTMMLLDGLNVVGGSLHGSDWTSWVSSLVMLQIICTLASLLVKLVLLVTRFETNPSEMFGTLALLAGVPIVALVLQGFNRCCSTTRLLGKVKCLSSLRSYLFRLVGLFLVLGGPYAVAFRFGDAQLDVHNLQPEMWNIACVFLGTLVTIATTVELLMMSNSPHKEVAKFQLISRYKSRVDHSSSSPDEGDNALEDVVAAETPTDHEDDTSLCMPSLQNVPIPPRPVHYISLQWQLPAKKAESKKKAKSPFAYVLMFLIEIVQWLAEVGPYKPFEKILYRRGSAIIAAFPLYFMASASYSSACAPYGYDDLFSMSRDDLFNCSYAELMQELSDYANTTVTLDRSPGSAFYDIIELRANSTIDGARISMLGISIFFFMAVLSVIEGLEKPLLRFRSSACLFAVTRKKRAQLPEQHRLRVILERISRAILAISQLLGVASIAVLCVATFEPYTLPYADLLHIACLCESGHFCGIIKSSITATFQNLQLGYLGKEILVLAVSIPWTLGRIAAFVHMDVSAETEELRHVAERKLENKLQAARENAPSLDPSSTTVKTGIITAAARTRADKVEDSHARNSVVWVAFACTSLFMLFVGTILGVAAAVMGVPYPWWVVALTALGGITPLLVVLFDAASCSRASHGTQFYTVVATFVALVGVPVATFTCFQLSGNPGPWDYVAILGMGFYSLSLLLSVLMPVVGGICCPTRTNQRRQQKRKRRRPTACGKVPWRQETFPEEMASEFHRVTHFSAILALFGAAGYCIQMALWDISPFASVALLGLLLGVVVLLFAFIFVPNFRLPTKIRYTAELGAKHPAKCKQQALLSRVHSSEDQCSVCDAAVEFCCIGCDPPCRFCSECAIAAWTRTQLSSRNSFISHTENIDVAFLAPSQTVHNTDGDRSDESDPEGLNIETVSDDPVATVIVKKRGGGIRAFKLVLFAHSVRNSFSRKTVLMYLAWGDAWFLFSLLYILSKILLFGAPPLATDLGINATQPCFSLLSGTVKSLFTADGWPFTLAEFFGADVVLTDIIFGAMALSRLCKRVKGHEHHHSDSPKHDEEEQSQLPTTVVQHVGGTGAPFNSGFEHGHADTDQEQTQQLRQRLLPADDVGRFRSGTDDSGPGGFDF